MKKKILAIVCGLSMLSLTACNFNGYDFVDTNYHFDRAIISMDNETIEIELASWSDSEDGEQLTLTAKDGTRYLVNSVNCILIEDSQEE